MLKFLQKLLSPGAWSIRWRLTLWHTAVVGLVLSIMGAIAVLAVHGVLLANADRALEVRASRAIDILIGGGKVAGRRTYQANPRTTSQMLVSAGRAFNHAMQDAEGDTFYFELRQQSAPVTVYASPNIPPHGYVSRSLYSAAPRISTSQTSFAFAGVSGDTQLRMLSVPLQGADLLLVVATPWTVDADVVGPVAWGAAVLIGLVTVVVALCGWFLIDRTLQPIDEIVDEAEKNRGGRMRPEFVASRTLGDDEIGRLVKSLNAMMERVHWAIERQRQFTADASHDLRTPLTILRGEIQFALARERSPREYRETLESLLEETHRLMRLVVDLGELARSDAAPDARDEASELFSVAELARRIVASRQAEAVRQDVALEIFVAPGASLLLTAGRSLDIERALANIIDNAIKYGRPGGRAAVAVACPAPDAIAVEVQDDGVGISDEDKAHIFERFYRGDKSRQGTPSGAGSGSGLGLAIAHSLVSSHGGRIEVESKPGQGSRFTVFLSAAAPDDASATAGEPSQEIVASLIATGADGEN